MFLCAWNSPAKNTEVGCHFLLQRIFPTQGSTHASYVSCTGSRLFTTDAHLKFFQFFLFLLVNHLLSVQLGWVGRERGRKETSYLSCTRCKALSLGTQCCAVLSRSVSNSATPLDRLLCPWGFFRQEYWSGLPFPPPGDLSDPGIKPRSPSLQADSLPSEPSWKQELYTLLYFTLKQPSMIRIISILQVI